MTEILAYLTPHAGGTEAGRSQVQREVKERLFKAGIQVEVRLLLANSSGVLTITSDAPAKEILPFVHACAGIVQAAVSNPRDPHVLLPGVISQSPYAQ